MGNSSNNYVVQPLGIICVVPMGNWNTTANYNQLNIVRHNAASWVAIQPNLNIEPGVAENWQTYWQLLCSDGSNLISLDGYSTAIQMSLSGNVLTVQLLNAKGAVISEQTVDLPPVVANPTAEPTDTLNSLQVGNTVYGLPSGDFELINSITTTEEVQSIAITQDSNGKAFNLKDFYVYIKIPPATSSARVQLNRNGNSFTGLIGNTDTVKNSTVKAYYKHTNEGYINIYSTLLTSSVNGDWTTTMSVITPLGQGEALLDYWAENNNLCDKISVLLSGANFPVGTQITLYGVRAGGNQ